jgi:hypothetical protein
MSEEEENMGYEIFKNIRINDNFTMTHKCNFCSKFSSTLVSLLPVDSFTIEGDYFRGAPKICNTCLVKFSSAISRSILSNLKKTI